MDARVDRADSGRVICSGITARQKYNDDVYRYVLYFSSSPYCSIYLHVSVDELMTLATRVNQGAISMRNLYYLNKYANSIATAKCARPVSATGSPYVSSQFDADKSKIAAGAKAAERALRELGISARYPPRSGK